jgi:glutamate N-acetyltransferase/amino-acid N-acetyltransferase
MKPSARKSRVTIPGFTFAAISAGIKDSGEKDLALIYSDVPAVTAALFTTNRIKAAPVKLGISRLSRQKYCRAVIINSGNANACTGNQGIKDARRMITEAAKELDMIPGLVQVSSTGIIGRPLPVEKIEKVIPALVRKLSPRSLPDAASAIMTTDTFPKISQKQIKIGNKAGTIAGIAKGSGMICPTMATMLCYICTDIAVTHKTLDSALRKAARLSFNRLVVDNDMSTNDTVMVLSNGSLGNAPLTARSSHYRKFEIALGDVMYDLSRMIAEDGEGATKLVEVIVRGARTESDAEKIGKMISNSMLVKTAIYGKDPNWGRIIAAIGSSGVNVREEKIDIYLNGIKLVSRGLGVGRETAAAKILSNKTVAITVDVNSGTKSAKILTCDLTEKYIKINAHYST